MVSAIAASPRVIDTSSPSMSKPGRSTMSPELWYLRSPRTHLAIVLWVRDFEGILRLGVHHFMLTFSKVRHPCIKQGHPNKQYHLKSFHNPASRSQMCECVCVCGLWPPRWGQKRVGIGDGDCSMTHLSSMMPPQRSKNCVAE